jgi:YHS domain-containing protein
MIRVVLFAVLLILFIRAAARLFRGLAAGMSGADPHGSVSRPSVQMVRDPVCGTFVVPERSITLSMGRRELHFCSTTCRDVYRARPS